jgi:hypothetical protein
MVTTTLDDSSPGNIVINGAGTIVSLVLTQPPAKVYNPSGNYPENYITLSDAASGRVLLNFDMLGISTEMMASGSGGAFTDLRCDRLPLNSQWKLETSP